MTKTTVVYGGPGTGKTQYMTDQVIDLLDGSDYTIDDIMSLSFTKSAAKVSQKRVADSFGVDPKFVKGFRTLHSQCYLELQDQGLDLVRDVDRRQFWKDSKKRFPAPTVSHDHVRPDVDGAILLPGGQWDYHTTWIQWWAKYPYESIEKAAPKLTKPSNFSIDLFQEFDAEWLAWKEEHEKLEFVDMPRLVMERKLIPEQPIQFYDEEQDVSPLLRQAAAMWRKNAEVVFIAGDPYQTIYTFIGAEPQTIMEMPRDETVVLEKTWRLPREIWDMALDVATKLPNYFPADKPVESIMARRRPCQIKRLDWGQLGNYVERAEKTAQNVMIIGRTNRQIGRVAHLLNKRGCSYSTLRSRGSAFGWPRDAVRLVNAYFRYMKGDQLSKSQIRAMLRYSKPAKDFWLHGAGASLEAVRGYAQPWEISRFIKRGVKFSDLWKGILAQLDPHPQEAIRGRIQFWPGQQVEELDYPGAPDNRTIQLGTIHAAKGDQATTVILLDGLSKRVAMNMGSSDGYADNCRVFYVGVSRARRNLLLVTDPKSVKRFPLSRGKQ